ncbi:hypothetical protein Salat_2768100 [Sesamum alatum]|uniref:Uncharacterized protein n=1 Tax=Sesamum alatum TaxID=300844 RepID=A0AAE2C9C8_9LAMI|nr:hypothetical protein Salat_2768100 [Sesamum alatum]
MVGSLARFEEWGPKAPNAGNPSVAWPQATQAPRRRERGLLLGERVKEAWRKPWCKRNEEAEQEVNSQKKRREAELGFCQMNERGVNLINIGARSDSGEWVVCDPNGLSSIGPSHPNYRLKGLGLGPRDMSHIFSS